MPFIKKQIPGKMPSLQGNNAYEWFEVDDAGNIIRKVEQQAGPRLTLVQQIMPGRATNIASRQAAIAARNLNENQEVKAGQVSKTERKLAPGIRAPDIAKGYAKPFNYKLWNKLRAEGKLRNRR